MLDVFLGVLVGRGTSPVSFDTGEFQESLARMVRDSEKEQKIFEKPELDFYEVLKSPVRTTRSTSDKHSEILPGVAGETFSETDGVRRQPAMKKSRKAMSFKSKAAAKIDPRAVAKLPQKIPAPSPVSEKKLEIPTKKGVYTIQIAAYRGLKDAMAQMKILKAKGFQSYRTMGRIGDNVWHRVRSGSFKDMAAAERGLKRLESNRIKGMIIKKE